MNAEELRSVQTPLKERYREAPEAALITLAHPPALAVTRKSAVA